MAGRAYYRSEKNIPDETSINRAHDEHLREELPGLKMTMLKTW